MYAVFLAALPNTRLHPSAAAHELGDARRLLPAAAGEPEALGRSRNPVAFAMCHYITDSGSSYNQPGFRFPGTR